MTPKSKTALFAGSFNPFTPGHLRIVERALQIADKVIVAVGHNINKPMPTDLDERLKAIERAVAPLNAAAGEKIVETVSYTGLTADFAHSIGANILVRGVRNISDFEYERILADVNLKILGIDTVFFCAEPEYSYLSSSTLRELKANGFDTSTLLPD